MSLCSLRGAALYSSATTIFPPSVSSIRIRTVAAANTPEFRVYFEKTDGQLISPLHDVPLHSGEINSGLVHMICEIPKWSNAKLEIATGEPFNPIKQDRKNGVARFIKNLFPLKGYPWNYGAVPQTWENPNAICNLTGFKGDNDPLDIVDISDSIAVTGEIKVVKILGILALVDEGETDWKVIGIDIRDPQASAMDDINDVEKIFPGMLEMTRLWFKMYKVPDGKPTNNFALDGQFGPRSLAMKIITETNHAWAALMDGQIPYKGKNYLIDCTSRQSKQTSIIKPGFNASSLMMKDIRPGFGDCAKSHFDLFPFFKSCR